MVDANIGTYASEDNENESKKYGTRDKASRRKVSIACFFYHRAFGACCMPTPASLTE